MPMDEWMKDPNAANLLKNRAALDGLLHAPETRQLMQMLQQTAGDSLQSAAQSAAKGDVQALMGIVQKLSQSTSGAQLIQKIQTTAEQQGK